MILLLLAAGTAATGIAAYFIARREPPERAGLSPAQLGVAWAIAAGLPCTLEFIIANAGHYGLPWDFEPVDWFFWTAVQVAPLVLYASRPSGWAGARGQVLGWAAFGAATLVTLARFVLRE